MVRSFLQSALRKWVSFLKRSENESGQQIVDTPHIHVLEWLQSFVCVRVRARACVSEGVSVCVCVCVCV